MKNERGEFIIVPELTEKLIDKWINKNVCVYISEIRRERNGFHTQIAINGILQKHPETGQYRIFVNQDTYTYFDFSDISSYALTYDIGRPNIELVI